MSIEMSDELKGRVARCHHIDCKEGREGPHESNRSFGPFYGAIPDGGTRSEAPSSIKLPFFEHMPESEFDEFYCGCSGWH